MRLFCHFTTVHFLYFKITESFDLILNLISVYGLLACTQESLHKLNDRETLACSKCSSPCNKMQQRKTEYDLQ